MRDIFFQLAFAAYLGAFFNLNPFVERDGYQILVDVLREPGLRRRAREQLLRRLSGQGGRATRRCSTRYAAVRGSRGRPWRPASRSGCRCATSRAWRRSRRRRSCGRCWASSGSGFFLPVLVMLGGPLRAAEARPGGLT